MNPDNDTDIDNPVDIEPQDDEAPHWPTEEEWADLGRKGDDLDPHQDGDLYNGIHYSQR